MNEAVDFIIRMNCKRGRKVTQTSENIV